MEEFCFDNKYPHSNSFSKFIFEIHHIYVWKQIKITYLSHMVAGFVFLKKSYFFKEIHKQFHKIGNCRQMKTLKVSCYYFQRESQVNACHHFTFWADGLSCREQFCYKLVTDAVNGPYLGQKYRQLSSLPKVCWIYF